MSSDISSLEPQSLWKNFSALNTVPRPSKKEERVIEFIRNFGEQLGLPVTIDEIGNVLITKPGTSGMQDKTTVVLQSHLDMVHQKNNDTNFDFNAKGIEMYIEGDWVKAKGTTLGADNGIGVASIMALLESVDIAHPPLEALFTIDEETGMTGAIGLKEGFLKGKILLNLDTEDDTELTIGCAGGIDVTASGTYEEEFPAGNSVMKKILIKGLSGGHSGMDIHLGKCNANKLMNRLLFNLQAKIGIRIASIDGGGLRNAIPRESSAVISFDKKKEETFEKVIHEFNIILASEYGTTDPEAEISVMGYSEKTGFFPVVFQHRLIQSIYACPNGIYRLSPDMKDLVQTSNNLARVLVEDGKYTIMCLTRSSVDTEKTDLVSGIESCFSLMGAVTEYNGEYPGWKPDPDASILKIMTNLYRELFESDPHVNACHAGLECGIIGKNYPEMEMISFGPNIKGAHSPDERVQISSVLKYWGFLLETLKRIE